MTDADERLGSVEARIGAIEDELAIMRLLYSYGPLVDSGEAEAAGQIYVEGGSLQVQGYRRQIAYHDIVAGLNCDEQKRMNAAGCMHIVASPHIVVNGDNAEATTYNLVVLREDGCNEIWRAAVNRWIFARTGSGWKVAERYSSAIDGSEATRALMLGGTI